MVCTQIFHMTYLTTFDLCIDSDTSKSKKAKQFGSSESDSFDRGDEPGDSLREGEPKPEELNKKAVFIIQRVRDKLTGTS